MRAVRACALLWPWLLSACLSTQDVSLGELPVDSGSPAGPDAMALADAMAAPADAEEEPDPREEAGSGGMFGADAGADAAHDASSDAGPSVDAARDASSDAESSADAARDASSDASDGNVPLICILEPWHCR